MPPLAAPVAADSGVKAQDPETGPYYAQAVAGDEASASGEVEEVTLGPDNHDFKLIVLMLTSGEVRVVAEFMETVG